MVGHCLQLFPCACVYGPRLGRSAQISGGVPKCAAREQEQLKQRRPLGKWFMSHNAIAGAACMRFLTDAGPLFVATLVQGFSVSSTPPQVL
eukprot:1000918-Amphidinium_carterae.1